MSVNEIAHAPITVGYPSYFPQNKTQDPGCGTCGAVDLICILDHHHPRKVCVHGMRVYVCMYKGTHVVKGATGMASASAWSLTQTHQVSAPLTFVRFTHHFRPFYPSLPSVLLITSVRFTHHFRPSYLSLPSVLPLTSVRFTHHFSPSYPSLPSVLPLTSVRPTHHFRAP